MISSVLNYEDEVEKCLNQILDDASNDYSTINKVAGLINYLKDDDFVFWLKFFNKIMMNCDILYNELQSKSIDGIKALKYIGEFRAAIQKISDLPELEMTTATDEGPSRKRARQETDCCKRSL